MRKLFIYIMMLSLSFSSCKKVLDKQPLDTITEKMLAKED